MPFVNGTYYPPEIKKVRKSKVRTVPQNSPDIVSFKNDIGLIHAANSHAHRHEKICVDN